MCTGFIFSEVEVHGNKHCMYVLESVSGCMRTVPHQQDIQFGSCDFFSMHILRAGSDSVLEFVLFEALLLFSNAVPLIGRNWARWTWMRC